MLPRGRGLGGIHHITCLSADPQANLDFYTGVLGLRLVKVSVNQDDPRVYHLFYADAIGSPGTDLTFFPYPGIERGVRGYGQATRIFLSVPVDSLDYWVERLRGRGVRISGPRASEDGVVVEFQDPEGLELGIVAHEEAEEKRAEPWDGSPVPREHFLRGFHSVQITVASCEHSSWFLEEVLGFRIVRRGDGRVRLETGGGGPGAFVDVLCPPISGRGFLGAGSVHHIAWAAADEEEQRIFRERLLKLGLRVTPVIDRKWFKSIYFREPGGVLYEIATEGPGFSVDEPPERLGTSLELPEWLEPQRRWIESVLPRIRLPGGAEIPARS